MATFKHTSKKIHREQVNLLFANSMVPIIVSILVSGLLCWSLWTVIDKKVLVAWFTLFFTVSAGRIVLLLQFKKQDA